MENSKVLAFRIIAGTVYFNCQTEIFYIVGSWKSYFCVLIFLHLQFPQVLGESMAGISQHCKTGDVLAFGESVGVASKALCGLTEAAGQVRSNTGVIIACLCLSIKPFCVCSSICNIFVPRADFENHWDFLHETFILMRLWSGALSYLGLLHFIFFGISMATTLTWLN